MTNIYIYVKPLWKVKGFFNRISWKVSDVHIVRRTWVLSSFSVSVGVSVSLSLCVVCCVVLCCVVVVVVVVVVEGGEEEGEGRRERLIEPSGPKFPSRYTKLNSLFHHPVADSLRSVLQDCWN